MRRRAFCGVLLATLPLTMDLRAENEMTNPWIGLWVTQDGHVRHELLPNGRYVEARGNREGAYRGRYEVTGNHIEYWDDTGFTADGDFIDGVLHHGGMILYRR
ncbi:Atu4866 domain-containing protein [Acetobacteraceae bacterium H6797]|nr:Atu4866 domain-containing protein [Acetobacteraceae bacterium H6797]